MPSPAAATLQTMFGQPPETAIKYLEQKDLVPTQSWHEIRDNAHNNAFVVSRLTRIDILKDIRESLVDAQKNGTPMEQWRKDLKKTLEAKGWWGKDADGKDMGTPWRLETIYRTNMQSAYMAGRRHEMLQAVNTHPYWRYVAIMDSLTRPNHKALNGRVMRYDDVAWQTIFPPCGYRCRCRVSPMTEGAVRRGGYTVQSSEGYIKTELVGLSGRESTDITVLQLPGMDVPFKVDPGFNGAPGQGALTQLIKKTEPDIAQVSKEWPVFSPAQATVEDFKKLGRQRLDELFAMPATNEQTVREVLDSASDWKEYVIHHDKLNSWVVRELERTRQAGTVAPNVAGSAQAKKALKDASSVYPASWVQDANNFGVLNVKYSSTARGWAYTAPKAGRIRLDRFGVVDAKAGEGFMLTDNSSTAVHEYAHRIQEARHDLDNLFQLEHRRRTAGEALQRLRDIAKIAYGADEVARPDGYYNPYMGREYKQDVGREALEVMTMALQPLLGNDLKSAKMLYELYTKDVSMLELALGILFHCK